VVLGRIAADQLIGGQMHLDVGRAGAAVDIVAQRLGLDRVAAAQGILRVANANMERAIRLVSVERGHDPRDFALVAFGGCGGLHACEMAKELGIRTVLVPEHAGALSALGMVLADHVRDYAAGVLGQKEMEPEFRRLELRARKDMRGAVLTRSADLRYSGQSYELNVPWHAGDPGQPFHREHQRIYGYANPGKSIEIVTIRVRAKIAAERPALVTRRKRDTSVPATRRVYWAGKWRSTPLYQRSGVGARSRQGPALVLDYGSTTLIPSGWSFSVDRFGNLEINL
jgi:N-methylhydantoinase A